MGKVVGPPIPNSIVKFTTRQPVFFVATAPLSSANHVNLSPKSGEEFRVLDERTVCYADYTGSGSETIAHLHENGRITIMFTAFEGSPNITRIFGTGRIVTVAQLFSRDTEENMKIRGAYSCPNRAKFNEAYHGCRGVIIVDVTRVGLSCGYSVPYMDFVKPRPILKSKLKTMNIEEYWKEKNSFSIDGLKGFYQEKTKQVPTKQWRVGGYEFAEYASRDLSRCFCQS
mmetsp:Transcript_25838/g.56148  ORF Transcript_25838/g.56148 Transcript_25838/m.56148 type:complete len:228 (-) Transcript_25838:172-855(-)